MAFVSKAGDKFDAYRLSFLTDLMLGKALLAPKSWGKQEQDRKEFEPTKQHEE